MNRFWYRHRHQTNTEGVVRFKLPVYLLELRHDDICTSTTQKSRDFQRMCEIRKEQTSHQEFCDSTFTSHKVGLEEKKKTRKRKIHKECTRMLKWMGLRCEHERPSDHIFKQYIRDYFSPHLQSFPHLQLSPHLQLGLSHLFKPRFFIPKLLCNMSKVEIVITDQKCYVDKSVMGWITARWSSWIWWWKKRGVNFRLDESFI